MAAQEAVSAQDQIRPFAVAAAGKIAAAHSWVCTTLSVLRTVLEPVGVGVRVEQAVVSASKNFSAPCSNGVMAGTEAQEMIDRHQPLIVSAYARIPLVNRRWEGRKLSVVSRETTRIWSSGWGKLVEAYGLPRTTMNANRVTEEDGYETDDDLSWRYKSYERE
jgi:hypothetical protein